MTNPDLRLVIERLRDLLSRATPGPWWVANKTNINSNPHPVTQCYFVNPQHESTKE